MPKNDKFFRVAIATVRVTIVKFCRMVELGELYILCPLAKSLSLIASGLEAKV